MRSTIVLLVVAVLACQTSARVIEIGGHSGWSFNLYGKWVPPEIYMWDQLAFVNTQSFLEPADVWQLPDEAALLNCNFTKATYIGNATTGNEILTPPWLLSYATEFFFADESNNGCQANQKIKITVLEGAAPPGTSQFGPGPAPAVPPALPPAPTPAPAPIEIEAPPKVEEKLNKDPNSAPSAIQGCVALAAAAVLSFLVLLL